MGFCWSASQDDCFTGSLFEIDALNIFACRTAERLRIALNELEGSTLDIGCRDNMLLKLYEQHKGGADHNNVGVKLMQWTDEIQVIESADKLPFADDTFDTVSFIACLNHIPERSEALKEVLRLLRPNGEIVIAMIGNFVSVVGHAQWWYGEDKQREMHPDELMGMDRSDVITLIKDAGFFNLRYQGLCYSLNTLYTARAPE